MNESSTNPFSELNALDYLNRKYPNLHLTQEPLESHSVQLIFDVEEHVVSVTSMILIILEEKQTI